MYKLFLLVLLVLLVTTLFSKDVVKVSDNATDLYGFTIDVVDDLSKDYNVYFSFDNDKIKKCLRKFDYKPFKKSGLYWVVLYKNDVMYSMFIAYDDRLGMLDYNFIGVDNE